MRRLFLVAIVFVLLLAKLQAQESPLNVLATSTIIADIARNVGGDFLSVQALVPPNTDIHAFEPLPSDLRLVEEADILLINGAGLEAFLGRMLENVSTVEPIVVGNGIEILNFEGELLGLLGEEGVCEETHHEEATEEAHEHGECDPHYWENPQNAMIIAENIAVAFAEADPDNAEGYFANAGAYIEELEALDVDIEAILSVIPAERRVIITNHDFLAYFAARYDFEVLATVIPSVTTLAEPSPQEISALIDVIRSEGINVIFAETGDSNRLAEVVANEVGGELQIVSLYSGSLGDADSLANSYISYMRRNAETIAEALGG
jgi:zinc/manganese transport system substrate-binding protein